MAIDPAVVAVWQIVIGIFVASIIIILTIWLILRLQRTHAYYRFGEAMSIGYAKLATEKIYRGALPSMPKSPQDVDNMTVSLDTQQTEALAAKAKRLEEEKKRLDSQAPPIA